LDEATVRFFCENANLFVEVIIAPGFSPRALDLLTTVPKWRNNVRLMAVGSLTPSAHALEVRTVAGGAVVQSLDNQSDNRSAWTTVTRTQADNRLLDELAFGWDMVRFVKSNAITLSKDRSLVGVGAGQMSRVDSVRIAIEKAGDRSVGSVLASDAFFPFPDSIPLAAAAGVAAIIQPGGSVKDAEVIAAADEHGIPMIFTGRRQFKH
jgi:phosphoribosylaminoimidazolecarboxamide formyltransferase/IMP cyclohydrolase